MRFHLWTAAALLVSLFAASPTRLLADAVTLTETPEGATTEYTVQNNSQTTDQSFDITYFLASSTSTSTNPNTTTVSGWIADTISPASWQLVPMGGPDTGLPTWQQYTGLTYDQAYPSQPVRVNGYFLDYSYDSGSGDVTFPSNPTLPLPGGSALGGFFFTGAPDSTFIAGGPDDVSTPTPTSDFQSFSATAVDVPEAGTFQFMFLSVAGAALLRRRSRHSLGSATEARVK
jgi:hypothetical protein